MADGSVDTRALLADWNGFQAKRSALADLDRANIRLQAPVPGAGRLTGGRLEANAPVAGLKIQVRTRGVMADLIVFRHRRRGSRDVRHAFHPTAPVSRLVVGQLNLNRFCNPRRFLYSASEPGRYITRCVLNKHAFNRRCVVCCR